MQAYAEIVHYQNTSANIALFDAVGGEEEAFVHSVRPFPFHLIPAYQPVMPWPFTKQKIDKDFILVCEFSEIIGPTSLITIPRDGGRNFDKDMFAVRIMAVDYNATNTMRCYASFTIVEDTSVIIEDKEENVYAYVHHFTLYDIHARGYVRPFCMAYVTPDKNKLFTFLEKLMAKFKSVSQLFRSGNQLLFKTELDQRLADLLYTKDSMQFPVATSLKMAKTSTANSKDNTDGTSGEGEEAIPCQRRRTHIDNSQEALTKAIQDCQGMLQELRQKMESSSFLSKYKKGELQNRTGCDECCLESLGYHSDSETVISTGSKTNLCNSTLSKSLSSLCKVTNCHCNSQPYQPKIIKVDACRRYDQSLRSLQKLSGKLGSDALNRLQKLFKIFSRDAVVLKLEHVESSLVNPSTTLLTIGRTVQINFLANIVVQSNNEATFRHRNRAGRTDSFLMETPSSCLSITSDSTQQSFPLSYDAEFVPGSTAASLESIYYDVEEGLDDGDEEKTQDTDDSWLEISITSRGEDRTENNDESPGLGGSFDVVSINSHSEVESVDLSPHQLMNGGTVPFVNGYDKGVQLRHLSSSSSIEPVLSRSSKVPVGCYASRLTSTNTDLPGADIRAFLHTYPFAGHLIYALLSGRTTIIAASPKREKEVYSLIRTLRLFVPGHSSNQLIIPWHTMSLTMCDLGRMKLVGLSKTRSLHRAIPASVFRFSTVFDYDSSKLWTPPYRGKILWKTISQCKQLRQDQSCIAAIETMMLKYSAKAYLFYHTYCLNSNLCNNQSEKQSQLTAAHFLAKINAIDGDAKIVQYWVDIIKQQQISGFLTQTNSSHVTKKMPIKLNYEGSKLYHA